MSSTTYRWLMLSLVGFLSLPLVASSATAQQSDEVPRATATVAIENATVVRAPGTVLDGATVVVRDGLILSVGRDVPIPFDAERISGDSLFVYAGFISGLSHAGISQPKASKDGEERAKDPGNPTPERSGIQPDRRAVDSVNLDDGSVGSLRNAGFAAAQVAHRGKMLPGSAAVISLGSGAIAPHVVNDASTLYAQFESASGVYPNTPLGMMAKFRQLYRNADQQRLESARYQDNPSGLRRPGYDPALRAFYPLAEGRQPLTFRAKSALEASRAVMLRDELGFALALAEVDQATYMIEMLQKSDAGVFLTMELPKDDADKKKDKKKDDKAPDTAEGDSTKTGDGGADADSSAAKEKVQHNANFRTASYADIDAEAKNLEARKRDTIDRYKRAPADLAAAGVAFGFSTVEVKPKDIHSNLRTMITAGLSEDDALGALTINAARILQVDDRLGTIDEGKIANLLVTSGSYFSEKPTLKFVFVDGEKFSIDADDDKKEDEDDEDADPVAAVGSWSYVVTTPQGVYAGKLDIQQNSGSFAGTVTGDGLVGTVSLDEVEVTGDQLRVGFTSADTGDATILATLDGDAFEGTVTVEVSGGEPMPIEATKETPNREF